MTSKQVNDWVNVSPIDQWAESRTGSTTVQQTSPLTFQGSGWLALMRDGKPVALTRARPFMPEGGPYESVEEYVWGYRDYWRPIDDKTAELYRRTLEVIE